ncbi:MAG: transcription-repair coupling factor [Chlamydiota bacterium]|nr:transcription-repair coupling factor [Chlamydiota bacterium]
MNCESRQITEKLLANEKLQELHQALQKGDSLLIEELWNAPKALIASIAQAATGKHVLILTGAHHEEMGIFHDFSFFSERPVVDFPAWETMPNESVAPSPDIVGERYQVLEKLTEGSEPHFVITSLQACLQKLILPKQFQGLYLNLKVGENHNYEGLIEQLKEMGYTRSSVAADKGEFAVRGGIIDVFPVSMPEPYRIEFWGDDIESIRSYDPIGQKSVETVKSVQITPAQEMELITKEDALSTIIDYLGDNAIVIFDDLLALEDRYAKLISMCGTATATFASLEELMDQIASMQKIYLSQSPLEELTEVHMLEKLGAGYYSGKAPIHQIGFEMFNRKLQAGRWVHPFTAIRNHLFPDAAEETEISGEEVLLSLGKLDYEKSELTILCNSQAEETNLHKRFVDAEVILPKNTHIQQGYLSSGFVIRDINITILPMSEVTKRYKIRRQKLRSTFHTTPAEVYDLSPGEMVVHLNNGIGKYLGQEKRPDSTGVEKEFMIIEYADNAKLYVPMNQVHMVSKYVGSNETLPKMHTLGSKVWQRTKVKTEKAIIGYAKDLLELYAKREIKGGYQYPEDCDDVRAFEEEFPFVETEDQLDAIKNIKGDMYSEKAMDRLVCGDVGYGKTEVAMRAAFKAVLDGGKQVAILVPTTVLAMQHYENFVERMRNFPVRIGVLSRFVKPKQRKLTLEGVANGSVDILIGTHRIISGDINFKNLGLVIIDEEHRFGVRVKEHLKRIKVGVDCITLSATPIPRTLYMSLIGARDMSVINTPPQDRLPIKTVITEPNDNVIKNALLRELARDGQAYYIHNRVETLPDVAAHIKKLLPGARVATVHGQMGSDEIDQVFHAYKSGNIDILVATTIVESGIDIPNANTMLIDKADHFGLADLYQMRGRVGRWNRRAYAYFLVRRLHALPEISRKRLNALAESTGYGGGMKLAMRDLEIRGAGDILGTEQSGHVSAIGFHFYCKMLKRTIKALQGKMPMGLVETKVDFAYDARLPEEYIQEASLRMEIYQRLGEAMTWEDVEDIWEELIDRYGSPPTPAHWLYHFSRIRVYAAQRGYSRVKIEKKFMMVVKKEGSKETGDKHMLKPVSDPSELEKMIIALL